MIEWDAVLKALVSSIVFSTIGLVFFAIAFVILQKVLPFSIRKEIEEDQNTALGIVLGSIFIAIAMIVSAAIHG
jgi:putative membrane protein